jgi:hypothetical protein
MPPVHPRSRSDPPARETGPVRTAPAVTRAAKVLRLQRAAGNRAVARILARKPKVAGHASAKPPDPDPRALTPQELWNLVEGIRGTTSRVPPHAVREADERLEQARQALAHLEADLSNARDEPALRQRGRSAGNRQARAIAQAHRDRLAAEVAQARKEVAKLERAARSAHANASEAPPVRPGTVNPQQLGHGVRTYAAIQIADGNGRRVATAVGVFTYDGKLHAEESALAKLRNELTRLGFKPGAKPGKDWSVTIVVDQEVCRGPCRPALRKFAADYGIKPENVAAHYPEQPGRDVSPKGASRTAHLHETTVPDGPGDRVLVEDKPGPKTKTSTGKPPPASGKQPTTTEPPPTPGTKGTGKDPAGGAGKGRGAPTPKTVEPAPHATEPTTHQPAPRSGGSKVKTGGGVLVAVAPWILGYLHERTRAGRVAGRAKEQGYVPQGDHGGFLDILGDLVFDPTGEGEHSVPVSARVNMAKWRQDLRGVFSGHKPGDAVVFHWDYYRGSRAKYSRWFIYVLGNDGRWFIAREAATSFRAHLLVGAWSAQPQERAAIAARHTSIEITPRSEVPPDINDVIDPSVPDSAVEPQMVYDETIA